MLLVCIAFIAHALLIDPLMKREKMLREQAASDAAQTRQIQQQIRLLEHNGLVDPDAGNKARMAELQRKMLAVDASLDMVRQQLVTPEKMPQLLEGLLKRNSQLKLDSFETLPASALEPFPDPAADGGADGKSKASGPGASGASDLPAYRHGFVLTVEGPYLDLMNYLATLEQLPWNMLWSKVVLTAGTPGICSLTLTVNTLSLDRAWLSL
ncbi:hypothetical protein GALL_417120 [mine drainage metagenome]|uniref:MSHA biogenesis protein MshJ n=1 Tax=mine drainage metagenome TaxID=410659 RepID=A0A1J5QKQ6_9ZZZZ